jgi:hypothetical protein
MFGPGGKAVRQDLGECVGVSEVSGMEVKMGDDLLLPPVRSQSDMGLPQLWPVEASGKYLLPV